MSSPPASVTSPAPRVDSIDFLRGVVMVLMALDHTRDFYSNALWFDPTDLAKTNPALFFTRWITHYCAPVFVFLAGTVAFLSLGRGKSKRDLSHFLITRGIWLIFLELSWVHFCWSFNFGFLSNGAAVIWALGWSMICLAGLIHLPTRFIALFGVVMILVHNCFDAVPPEDFDSLGWLWMVLHSGGGFAIGKHISFGVGYPLIPWIGVMAAGYAFGEVMKFEPARRRSWLWRMGIGLVIAFILLRWSNAYGDRRLWQVEKNPIFTLMSFLNCWKYPPSLLYLLMTLGPALIFLAVCDRGVPARLQPLVVFGRVPMFYYLLHLPLAHASGALFGYFAGHPVEWMFKGGGAPKGFGWSLPIVYLAWLGVVFSLYPLCRWFAALKKRNRSPWLTYF